MTEKEEGRNECITIRSDIGCSKYGVLVDVRRHIVARRYTGVLAGICKSWQARMGFYNSYLQCVRFTEDRR
jgi:hypothetical protein